MSQLGQVYWIGGGSGAGKSTIARHLAARYGLDVYSTDAAMADHGTRITREDAPFLADFASMTMDERWLDRSPDVMLETFHWFRGEGFSLITEDLLARSGGLAVIAEGFRLLPHLVRPLLPDLAHAVWLLPTPAFRRAALERRGSLWQIPNKTSDPVLALRNLLDRDRLFTDRLREETEDLGLHAIEVDATMTEAELTGQMARLFGF